MQKSNSTLEELHRLLGSDALKQILESYQESLIEFETFLKSAKADSDQLKKIVLQLESPSLSVGEIKIASFCQRLEKAGMLSDKDRASGLEKVEDVRNRFNAFLSAL